MCESIPETFHHPFPPVTCSGSGGIKHVALRSLFPALPSFQPQTLCPKKNSERQSFKFHLSGTGRYLASTPSKGIFRGQNCKKPLFGNSPCSEFHVSVFYTLMKNRFKLSLSLSSRCNKNQPCDNSPPPSPAHSQLCAQMHTLDPSLPLFCYFFFPFGMKNEEEGPCLGTACSLKQVQQLLFGALSLLQCLGSVAALHDK